VLSDGMGTCRGTFRLTSSILMGRKTYESIGRPLSGRTNIIVTRNKNYSKEGCTVVSSLEGAYELAKTEADETMIIGGAEIFHIAFADIQRLYLTDVHSSPEGDVIFPEYNRGRDFKETWREDHEAEGNTPAFSFVILDRK
jgi:dihydrofolate reductase